MIDNIRKLAAAHWWDGTSINRVQDNYVVEWGDASEKKASPAGLVTVPQSDYETDWADLAKADYGSTRFDPAGARSFDNGVCDMTSDTRSTRACERIRRADVYADDVLFYRSWPVASQASPVGAGAHHGQSTAMAWSVSGAICRPIPAPARNSIP